MTIKARLVNRRPERGGRSQIVGRLQRRLQVEQAVHQRRDRGDRFARRQEPRAIVRECADANRIALSQRHIRQEQQGIQRVVEMRHRSVLGAHALSAIEHQHDLLVALVLVLPGDEPSGPCRGAPVDLAWRVVLPVVAELVELQSLTAPASLQDADLREAIVGGEPRVMHDSSEVRVDANARGLPDRLLVVPQPERRVETHVQRAQTAGAALERTYPIGQPGDGASRHRERLAFVLRIGAGRARGRESHPRPACVRAAQHKGHGVPQPDRERSRRLASHLEPGRGATSQPGVGDRAPTSRAPATCHPIRAAGTKAATRAIPVQMPDQRQQPSLGNQHVSMSSRVIEPSRARCRHAVQNAHQQGVGCEAFDIGVGRWRHAMAQRRQGHGLHVVGRCEAPPVASAFARDARTRAIDPRGPAPAARRGASRVARTIATAYAMTRSSVVTMAVDCCRMIRVSGCRTVATPRDIQVGARLAVEHVLREASPLPRRRDSRCGS